MHDRTTARHSSFKLITTLTAIIGLSIWTQDISQAYLQSESTLLWDVYIRPRNALHFPSGHQLKLLRPLYELSDSGDYWSAKFGDHLQNDLQMQRVASDMSLFFKMIHEKVAGITATHIDNTLSTGSDQFTKETTSTSKNFEAKGKEFDNTKFSGVYIETLRNGSNCTKPVMWKN